MNAREALDRTMLLMRDDLDAAVTDGALLEALTGVTVLLVGDRANLASPEGQLALGTTALLCARSGASCFLAAPSVSNKGVYAGAPGGDLHDVLRALVCDLIPGVRLRDGTAVTRPDVTVMLGDTQWRGPSSHSIAISGDAWAGRITADGNRWGFVRSPFGALAAAGLAAGEAYKVAMRRLVPYAVDRARFDEQFAPVGAAQVSLAPPGTGRPTSDLGSIDVISAGAVANASVAALASIPGVRGSVRVFDATSSDSPDLNRYHFLRASEVGANKALALQGLALGDLRITGVPTHYDAQSSAGFQPLADSVLVGVDHIPTRWLVQAAWPGWLGVGATSHYGILTSFHSDTLPCAWCLHPENDSTQLPAPTVAFVSHWAGLKLASLLVRHLTGHILSPMEQASWMVMLRPDNQDAVFQTPVTPRPDCPLQCQY